MGRICGIQVGRCEPDGTGLNEPVGRRDTSPGNVFMTLDRKESRRHWYHRGMRLHLWICTSDGQCRRSPSLPCTQTPTQTPRNPASPHRIPQTAHRFCPYLPLLQRARSHRWHFATTAPFSDTVPRVDVKRNSQIGLPWTFSFFCLDSLS